VNVLSIIHYPIFVGPHNTNLRLIPRLRDYGINTTVVLPDEPGNAADRFRNAGIEVLQVPLGRVRARPDPRIQMRFITGLWPQVQALRKTIREREIDVVWLNAMIHPHGAIAARLEGVPILWHLIDTYPPMILRRVMMPFVTRMAACVMTDGLATARAHPGAVALGSRLIVFAPPVDSAVFKPDAELKARIRHELGITEDERVAGNVANFAPYKDHLTFVRAAAQLRKTHPKTRFLLLGRPYEQFRAYADSVAAESERLGLRVGYDLIIHDAGDRVAEFERAFDVFWMTSNAVEAGPSAMFEAMASGLPIVATDVGSSTLVLEEGVTGFVVRRSSPEAIAAATRGLFDDPQLCAAMGARARKVAIDRFDVAICTELHARALKMSMQSRAPASVATISA
jgi:glycosyltransferase involved in cell wall biosynthesis